MRQEGIVINPDRPPFGESATTTESWWADPSRDFYAEARSRFPYEPVTFHQHGWGS